MAKKIKRNPYRYKENPITLMSPFRSQEFDDAMKEFQKLKTDQIKVGDAVRIGSAKAKDQDFTNFYKDIQNPYQNMERFTEELTVDQRDELLDSVDYSTDEDGGFKIKMLHTTMTKFIRASVKGSDDKFLSKLSFNDKSEIFQKVQSDIMNVGEEKASD